MRYRPNPESRLEAYQWNGDLKADIPRKWRDRYLFTVADDGSLIVPTPHGPSECKLGDHVGQDEARNVYPIQRAIMLARWIPDDDEAKP